MKNIKLILFCTLLFVLNNDVKAQVRVMEEPHHKPVLINDYVRLLDVHINPNDTTLYHIHATPSVIVILSNSTIGTQKKGEAPLPPNQVTAGQTSFVDYSKNPVTHRVFNAGKNIFHVMDIELVRDKPFTDSCSAVQGKIQAAINEKAVKVYKFTVAAHQSFNIQKTSCAHLLVCISGGINTSAKQLTTGEYEFFDPDTLIGLNNKQNENAVCVILELK